jgi:hypothetical protein
MILGCNKTKDNLLRDLHHSANTPRHYPFGCLAKPLVDETQHISKRYQIDQAVAAASR